MSRVKTRLGAVACLAVMVSGIALAGERDPRSLAHFFSAVVVPDRGNNRVLIYNHPSANGQSADVVLGQSSFTSGTFGTSASTMDGPSAYAVDHFGNLYVSDSDNCRVLQFRPPFTNGQAAHVVIGKPDFDTGCTDSPAASASNTGTTAGVAIDLLGNLWVADGQNSRVLRFKPPFQNGQAADLVIGQPNFSSTDDCPSSPTAATLCNPEGVAFDYFTGRLWVADTGNNRVLGFRPRFKNNMNASLVLGQADFTSKTFNEGGVSATALFNPTGIGVDLLGRLWVADAGNSRVLRFKPPYRNGKAASLVLGQTGFTQSAPNQSNNPTAATLSSPQGIVIRLSGDVWVGDTDNHRTLRFAPPFSNGMNASLVLGQVDFTQELQNQGNPEPGAATQNAPFKAGPSLIALAVLAGLVGGRQWLRRLRRSV